MSGFDRDYGRIADEPWPTGPRLTLMELLLDRLWSSLREQGVSWMGFYLERPDEPADRCLELGPHRDRLACSPIGVHGVCGQALMTGETRIVHDVRELGSAYVACDPRDLSEIVVPLPADEGGVRSVLDLDSRQVGAFDHRDASGLELVLRASGLIVDPRPVARRTD